MERMWNNIRVKGMSVSIQNYRMMPFTDIPFQVVILRSNLNLLNFSGNILRGFQCILCSQ
jgi:hypothetical protein